MPKDCNKCGKEFVPDPDTCVQCIAKKNESETKSVAVFMPQNTSNCEKKYYMIEKESFYTFNQSHFVFHSDKNCSGKSGRFQKCRGGNCIKHVCILCCEFIPYCYDKVNDVHYASYYCTECWNRFQNQM